jgi:hypothetical protein
MVNTGISVILTHPETSPIHVLATNFSNSLGMFTIYCIQRLQTNMEHKLQFQVNAPV